MKTSALVALVLAAASSADAASRPIRVYVAGESIERRNRWVAPPFTPSGALNERGGGELRNDNDEYGWMVPLRDRLRLRAPDLDIVFVGSDEWADAEDATYTGTYPSTTAEPTSAISGTTIPSWLEQRREELSGKQFCYDLAFASRGGNDFGNDNDAEYVGQLKDLILLLARGSSCRADPVVVVTGHMPDYQFGEQPDATLLATVKHRFVERARQAVNEVAAANPEVRVRFVDQYTPFTVNQPTTAFPFEVWSTAGVPDYEKIERRDDSYHPRRLSSIYAGELAADGLDLAEMRGLVGSSPIESTWILPSSARAAGVGTFFTTDLTIRNTGNAAATATLKFLGHTGDGRTGPEQAIALAAGETKTYTDVLGSLFGLTNDFGPIRVKSTGALVVQGQTSTPGGGGTYGQSVPAVPAAEFIDAAPRSIVGVSQNGAFRTNLMLANAEETSVDVDVVLAGPGGGALATKRVAIGPLSFAQLNVANDLGVADVSGAAIRLSTPTPSGHVAGYASAIDRTTGDPRTLLPGSGTGSEWILPSSARAAGIGTFFTTDLVLRNVGSASATATVKFLGHTGDGRSGPEKTVTLAAGETKTYADVLSSLFGLDTDFGPIRVRSTGSLVAQGQTSTPGGGGTFGQSVPAIPLAEFIGQAARTIVGVSQDAAFRTNLMLANATESPLDVDVALVAPGAAILATRRVTIGPLSFAQLNVANDLGIASVTGAAFVLSTPTAGGRFAAYASAIDRVTGDPRTLLPR